MKTTFQQFLQVNLNTTLLCSNSLITKVKLFVHTCSCYIQLMWRQPYHTNFSVAFIRPLKTNCQILILTTSCVFVTNACYKLAVVLFKVCSQHCHAHRRHQSWQNVLFYIISQLLSSSLFTTQEQSHVRLLAMLLSPWEVTYILMNTKWLTMKADFPDLFYVCKLQGKQETTLKIKGQYKVVVSIMNDTLVCITAMYKTWP